MNDEISIYLLAPSSDTTNIPTVLIWSKNEAIARTYAYAQYEKTILPEQQISALNNPYECNVSVTCRKLIPNKEIQILKTSENSQEIRYNNRNYFLTVDHPIKVI